MGIKNTISILFCLLLSSVCQQAFAQPYNRSGKDFALFFAISDYDEWSNLSEPVKNAETIAGILRSDYGFETEVVPDPSLQQIYAKLDEYRQRSYSSDSQLLIFFGGHGYRDQYGTGFFVPKTGKRSGNDHFGSSYIPYSRLREIVDALPVSNILFAMDACYSGILISPFNRNRNEFGKRPGETDEMAKTRFINEGLETKTRLVLTSGGNQRTPDPSEFAKSFLEALKNGGKNFGILNFDDLWSNYLQYRTPKPQKGKFASHNSGDFLFLKKREKPNPNLQAQLYNVSKQQADNLRKNGAYDEAITNYHKAIRYSNKEQQSECESWVSECYYLRNMAQGKQLLSISDCQKAKKHFEKALYYKVNDEKALQQIIATDDCIEKNKRNTIGKMPVSTQKSGDVVIDLPLLEMVYVKGGTFNMGNTGYGNDEKPIHEIKIGDFEIGKYEVTQAQWRKVMDSDPLKLRFKGCNDCPVEGVSWNDIQEFLHKLNKLTGQIYRLPTEAEWEFAARGGNKSRGYKYAGGNTMINLGWNGNNSDNKTHPVGQKAPNELGIYDMSGNVSEWCQDWYGLDYYANSPKSDPQGPFNGVHGVYRGGSWYFQDYYCRVTDRNFFLHNNWDSQLGFRIVREP